MKPSGLHPVSRLVAENIAKYSRKRKLSALALSNKAGLSRSHVGKILRGKINPGLDTLIRIAQALDVDFHDLVKVDKGVMHFVLETAAGSQTRGAAGAGKATGKRARAAAAVD